MREPGHMASPLLLSLLLLRGVGAWLDNRTTASACGSEYITVVVASSSSLRAAARSRRTIAGCYVRNNYFVSQGRPVYTKTTGGTTYGVLGSQASDSVHGGPRWVIARVHEPDSFMDMDGVDMDVVDTGAVDRPGSVEAEVGVEVLVCTTSEDWWTTGSPSRVQDWICEAGGDGSLSVEEGSVFVRCGCSGVDAGVRAALDAMGGDGGDGDGGGGGGVGGGTSGIPSASGAGQTAYIRRRRRAEVVAATDGSSTSSSNSDTSSSGNDFSGFWSWIVISACVAGLIVLCCVGWYIRNPWCKSAPLADPNASVEDAVPQAPKTAFQPWGASQPPK